MKIVNLLFISLFSMVSLGLTAQVDVGCSAIKQPSQGDTVYNNTSLEILFTLRNFGSAIAANHPNRIRSTLFVDGDNILTVNLPQFAFPAGGTQDVDGSAFDVAFGSISPALTDGIHEFCIVASIANDADITNDTSCVDLYYASSGMPALDIEIINLPAPTITSPTPEGSDFLLGISQQIETIRSSFLNVGTNTIPTGLEIPFLLTIGNMSQTIPVVTTENFLSGAGAGLIFDRSLFPTLLDFPTTPGEFDVCVVSLYPREINTSNDTMCTTYNMLAPEPSGVESATINARFGKVFYANNALNIAVTPAEEGVKQVQIVDMQGQYLYNEPVNLESGSAQTIDLSYAPAGIYVVNIEGYTTSFVKQ